MNQCWKLGGTLVETNYSKSFFDQIVWSSTIVSSSSAGMSPLAPLAESSVRSWPMGASVEIDALCIVAAIVAEKRARGIRHPLACNHREAPCGYIMSPFSIWQAAPDPIKLGRSQGFVVKLRWQGFIATGALIQAARLA